MTGRRTDRHITGKPTCLPSQNGRKGRRIWRAVMGLGKIENEGYEIVPIIEEVMHRLSVVL